MTEACRRQPHPTIDGGPFLAWQLESPLPLSRSPFSSLYPPFLSLFFPPFLFIHSTLILIIEIILSVVELLLIDSPTVLTHARLTTSLPLYK